MKWILVLFFLASCVSPNPNVSPSNEILDFNDELTFEELNDLLIKYADIAPYPNIDQ